MLASYEVKAAAAGLAVCLIGISAAVYHASTKLAENARLVSHTRDVVAKLEAAGAGVADAETELRRSLLPDLASLAETRCQLAEVRKITAGSPRQQARIDRLEQAIRSASRIPPADRSPEPLEEIRRGIQEMEHQELEVLASRFSEQESSSRRVRWMVLLSCAAALFLLCVSLAVVFHDLSSVETAFRKARYHVAHDTLTGLASRHSLMAKLDFAITDAAGTGQPLSVCLCDIDRFKSINDVHGHAAGDEILASFGKLVRAGIRKDDIAGRLGGDEFCIVLPDTGGDRAGQLMERLRERWERLEYRSPDGRTCSVTASFGVVQYSGERSAKALLQTADKALYCAKGEGRNRIHLVA